MANDLLDQVMRDYRASQQLEKAGSVMAPSKVAERKTRESQGPLMYTILNMLKGGGLDPTTAGGPSKAMIPPGIWKGTQPEAKALLNMVGDKFPEFFSKVLKDPRELLSHVLPNSMMPVPKALGTVERVNPLINRMSINANQLGTNSLMDTVVHELQHVLNVDRVKKTSPEDAATIGTLLNDILPRAGKGSLELRLGQLAREGKDAAGSMEPDLLSRQFGENWKDLAPSNKARFTSTAYHTPTNPRLSAPVSGYTANEPWGDFLQRSVMDEGLAHLAERTAKPYGDKKLMELANKLKVGTGMKPQNVEDYFKDLPEVMSRSGFRPEY